VLGNSSSRAKLERRSSAQLGQSCASLGSTGQCPVCQTAQWPKWPLSEKVPGVMAKNHRTVPCAPDCPVCTGLSGEPGGQRLSPASTVDAQSAVDTWRPRHLGQRPAVALDCPVRHRTIRYTIWSKAANGRLGRLRKGIAHCWMSGVHRTVRCTHGQKATRAFQTKEQRLPWHLGL
jgi:hypothetical protein